MSYKTQFRAILHNMKFLDTMLFHRMQYYFTKSNILYYTKKHKNGINKPPIFVSILCFFPQFLYKTCWKNWSYCLDEAFSYIFCYCDINKLSKYIFIVPASITKQNIWNKNYKKVEKLRKFRKMFKKVTPPKMRFKVKEKHRKMPNNK